MRGSRAASVTGWRTAVLGLVLLVAAGASTLGAQNARPSDAIARCYDGRMVVTLVGGDICRGSSVQTWLKPSISIEALSAAYSNDLKRADAAFGAQTFLLSGVVAGPFPIGVETLSEAYFVMSGARGFELRLSFASPSELERFAASAGDDDRVRLLCTMVPGRYEASNCSLAELFAGAEKNPELELVDLVAEYEANALRADRNHLGRLYRITGTIAGGFVEDYPRGADSTTVRVALNAFAVNRSAAPRARSSLKVVAEYELQGLHGRELLKLPLPSFPVGATFVGTCRIRGLVESGVTLTLMLERCEV
jgi:hypothetical protein